MATTNKKQTKTKVNKEIKKTAKKKPVKKDSATSKKTDRTAKTDEKIVEKKSNVTETQPVTANKAPTKRRIVVNYNQLEPELIEVLNEKYPSGWRDYILKVEKGNGEFFHAIMLDTEDVSYLIKVSVKVDSDITDDIEKDLFGLGHDDDFMVDDEADEDYDDKDEHLS
ncbi:MAG: hypothetical protein LBE11_07500 [Prevotellaceae bacterium]|jgi:hypothetical protein|nr:hypothetical protein [Prevotellaceae bacterium]